MDNKKQDTEKKEQNKKLDKFLGQQEDCQGDECLVKGSNELVERIDKKYITDDGRQLLF